MLYRAPIKQGLMTFKPLECMGTAYIKINKQT